MTRRPTSFAMLAVALAASVLVAACGGGDVAAPDTVAPTVSITSSAAGTTATGAVTFTFTFSEDVGTTFTAEDIVVNGGTAGALTKASATVYTLVVTPAAGASGNISVAVAAAKYGDLSNNANTAASAAEQAFSTVTVVPPSASDTVLANFDDVAIAGAFGAEGGDGSGIAVNPPAGGGSGQVYQVLRSGGQPYALAILPGAFTFAADRKTVSAMVYSPTAGIRMVVKFEGPGGANTGDVDANETVVVGWQTLTWTVGNATAGTVYDKLVLLPNLGNVDAPPGKSYFFDDIKLKAAAVVAPPSSADTVIANFDDVAIEGAYGGEGGDGSGIAVNPPAGGGSGQVYQVLRSGGQPYALAILPGAFTFTADRKTVSAVVYSPTAGIRMVIKFEGPGGANTGDVDSNQAVVAGWQTLTWTVGNATAGTVYDKLVLLPNLGNVDAPPGKSYFFDDIKLKAAAGASGGGSGGSTASTLPVTFNDSAVTYTLRGFEGAEDSSLVADPAGGSNTVVKVVKAAGAPWYAGTVVSTGPTESIARIPFTDSAKTMKLRVFSPGAGMVVRLKVENANDVNVTSETDATTTGTGWETLTFNFANPGLAPPQSGGPTAALNVAQTYNKAVVFMNVAPAAVGAAGTFYFDDLAFGTP